MELMEIETLQSLISRFFAFYCRLLKFPEFYQEFYSLKNVIIFDLGLGFMRTFSAELEEMTDNPTQFVRVALDTCDRQRLTVMKCQASKLVETMCDRVDGQLVETGKVCC